MSGSRRAAVAAVLLLAACGDSSAGSGGTFASFTPRVSSADGWGADAASPSLGFRPTPDGLGFANFVPADPFDASDAIALFGASAVCEELGTSCVPRPEAQAWIDTVAAASLAGVCEGMALLALDRFAAGAQPATAALPDRGETVARIRQLFATQFLPQVADAARQSRSLGLDEIVSRIEDSISGGEHLPTLGLYSEAGGHALVPYAVRHIDSSHVTVYVYDPNWPGADRFVEFDLAADRWRFSYATLDVVADPAPWFGDAGDIDLVDLEDRESPFDEPFAGAGSGLMVLTVSARNTAFSVVDGDTVTTGARARPGDGRVLSVARQGLLGATVSLLVSPDAEIELPDGGDVAVTGTEGTVRVSATSAARLVVVGGGRVGLRIESGPTGTPMRAYAPGGVVTVDGATGSQLGVLGDGRSRYSSPTLSETFVAFDGVDRIDGHINPDGSIERSAPESYAITVPRREPDLFLDSQA